MTFGKCMSFRKPGPLGAIEHPHARTTRTRPRTLSAMLPNQSSYSGSSRPSPACSVFLAAKCLSCLGFLSQRVPSFPSRPSKGSFEKFSLPAQCSLWGEHSAAPVHRVSGPPCLPPSAPGPAHMLPMPSRAGERGSGQGQVSRKEACPPHPGRLGTAQLEAGRI